MGFGRRKQNIIKKTIIILGIITLLSVISYAGYYYFNSYIGKIEKKYVDKIEELKLEKYMLKREVYIPIEDINEGVVINKDNVKKKEIYSEMKLEEFINEKDLGSILRISVKKNMPILKNMVCKDKLKDDLRLREISSILLQSDLKTGDSVDFRIRYSNGLEFIVLSKKIIKNLDLENNTIWINLTERESLMLSSALVDKAIFQGTSFYINKYIESNLQKKSRLNYIPNINVINLVKNSKSIKDKFSLDELGTREKMVSELIELNKDNASKIEESLSLEESKVESRIEKEKEIENKIKKELEENNDDGKDSDKDGFN